MTFDAAAPPLVQHSVDPQPTPPGVWLGLTLAPIAWAAQGLSGWWVASQACAGHAPAAYVRTVLLSSSAVALVVGLAGFWLALGHWRRWRRTEESQAQLTDRERLAFMAIAGVLVSACLTSGIVLTGIAESTLSVCELIR